MYTFDYKRPNDTAKAAELLKIEDDGAIMSGGMTLLPTMKQKLAAPSALIDITAIADLQGIDRVSDDTLRIKACTTHANVAASDEVRLFCVALAKLANGIGDPAVRHRGTIGGSVANNDPAADYPAAVMALGRTVITQNRQIAASDFFVGMFETALDEGEILTAIDFARPTRAGYGKFPNPASRYAMAGVMIAQFADNDIRVAVTGAGNDGVFRWTALEEALANEWGIASIDAAAIDEATLLSDMHGAADYRGALIRAMAKEALQAAG